MTNCCVEQPRSDTDLDVIVIVAVKNGAASLEACLLSILGQEGPVVGIIVIDGGSTDGTLQIIDRYRPQLTLVLSDAKLGVYDAWNQALKHCNSPWIAFLGCDDRYSEKTAISKLLDAVNKTPDRAIFSYSQVSYRDSADKELSVVGQPWQVARAEFEYRMSVNHVGALHARELFESGGFDTTFRIVADYEFLFRQRERLSAVFVAEALVHARVGGISTRRDLAILQKRELKRVLQKHNGTVFAKLFWYFGMAATLASLAVYRLRKLDR